MLQYLTKNYEVFMSSLQERAAARSKSITLQKVALHSENHHSFHIGLDTKESWELLARLSKEAWFEQTGQMPPSRVDKSLGKFIHLAQRT